MRNKTMKFSLLVLLVLVCVLGIFATSCNMCASEEPEPKPEIKTAFNIKSFSELKSLSLENGTTSTDKYYVAGYVKEIKNEIITISDKDDNTFIIDTLYDVDGEISYEQMTSDKPVVDSIVVVYGVIMNDNNTFKMKDGCLVQLNDKVFQAKPTVEPEVTVSIQGKSEVRSGKEIKLTSYVDGVTSGDVIWSIKSGAEYASINENGLLSASNVNGDKIIEVMATSTKNSQCVASKVILIVAKPNLTQEMLDALKVDKIGFEGYLNIDVSEIGISSKPISTYTSVLKTAMDGTNWYAEYANSDTGTNMGIYIKNHNGIASKIGVSFANDETYEAVLDDDGNKVSWEDSGFYNNLKNLTVNDFIFNEDTWRYEYKGTDKTLTQKLVASANPYDFEADPNTQFQLIIEENEILGFYALSKPDYNLAKPNKAVLELFVAVDCGDAVEVPTISKYPHYEFHDELTSAIAYMQSLDSYTLDFLGLTASYLTKGYVLSGYTETICNDICYFRPYTIGYDEYGKEKKNYTANGSYGYKKINDTLYNTFYEDANNANVYSAARAYATDFTDARPTFNFAAEIFTKYIENEDGSISYYVDDVMCAVASTFYYGVGNDVNLYGLFATNGSAVSFDKYTPFITVKDGKIIATNFYFYLGSIFGDVSITYSDFNEAKVPDDIDVKFDTRLVPTSWDELEFIKSSSSSTTEDDEMVNAKEFLYEYYEESSKLTTEEIEQNNMLPFFGSVLGDTYGFGMLSMHIPNGDNTAHMSITLYYDVPLDIDYTINSSLEKIGEYLKSIGFTDLGNGEYSKTIQGTVIEEIEENGIKIKREVVKDKTVYVAPVDSSLDLIIYMWGTDLYQKGE